MCSCETWPSPAALLCALSSFPRLPPWSVPSQAPEQEQALILSLRCFTIAAAPFPGEGDARQLGILGLKVVGQNPLLQGKQIGKRQKQNKTKTKACEDQCKKTRGVGLTHCRLLGNRAALKGTCAGQMMHEASENACVLWTMSWVERLIRLGCYLTEFCEGTCLWYLICWEIFPFWWWKNPHKLWVLLQNVWGQLVGIEWERFSK